MTISSTTTDNIQAALNQVGTGKAYSTLHLNAGTYTINTPSGTAAAHIQGILQVNPGSIIEGEIDENGTPTVIFQLMDNAPVSMFQSQVPIMGFKAGTADGVTISKIAFNGRYLYQTGAGAATTFTGVSNGNTITHAADHGNGFHNFIGNMSYQVTNSVFHDIKVYDTQGDGIRLNYGGYNVEVYNFNVFKCGHDAIFFKSLIDVWIHDCEVLLRTNSAVRLWSCQNVEVWNVEVYTAAGVAAYSPGFEIHGYPGDTSPLQNIRIHDCYVHGTLGPGAQFINPASNSAKDIFIYNCIFKDCGQMPASNQIPGVGGIIVAGIINFQVYNCTFVGNKGYAIGVTYYDMQTTKPGSLFVKNNIFINTVVSNYAGTSSGSAVANLMTTTHSVQSSYNCFYNNVLNYKNVSGSNDLTVDPQIYDAANSDFHLKSTHGRWNGSSWAIDATDSPCINAGDPASDYSREPTDGNGGRVNIGRYGNTSEASKSQVGTSSGGILYVGFSSVDSDIVCNGSADDVQIQQALDTVRDNPLYTTVHLNPGTYDITKDLLLYSNMIFEGEAGAKLRLTDAAEWEATIPIISQGSAYIHDIEIRNIEVDGNRNNQTEADASMYYNIIYFLYADAIKIHDVVLHDCKNDGIRLKYTSGVDVYGCLVYDHGNIGIHMIESSYVSVHENAVKVRIEAGISITDTNHAEVFKNNVFADDASDAGIAGIRVIHSKTIVMDDIEIYENRTINTYGPGLMLYNTGSGSANLAGACNAHIHHNSFKNCGRRDDITHCAGIAIQGWHNTLIENNNIHACYRYGIVAIVGTGWTAPLGTGYATEIRNNIISGILEGGTSPTGTGKGVANTLTSTHTINCHHNCVYDSASADYQNVTPSNDINMDPLWYDPDLDDYHVKSTHGRSTRVTWEIDDVDSPCIDAGDPSSNYSNEPEGNGARINIGRYGNTAEASLSSNTPGDPGGNTDPGYVGTEIIDGRSVIYAEYVPETTMGTTPGAPVFRAFPGYLTKIGITNGAKFDEFDALNPPQGNGFSCGVAVKKVGKMPIVKVHCKPSSLDLLAYAICAADTASYTSPGTSIRSCTIGVRVGSKYTVIKGCVLQELKYVFSGIKNTADCVMTFFGIERTDWSTTDYAAFGSPSTAPTASPYTMTNISNMTYDGGDPKSKGIIIDSIKIGFKNSIKPVISIAGLTDSKIVGWAYEAAEMPLELGVSLMDTTIQDSVLEGNAHTLSFALGGKTFSFSSVKWVNSVDLDADPGAAIGMSLAAAAGSSRVVFT